MIGFLKKLFGGDTVNLKELVQNGAQIIDVRTPAEFSSGSIRNSRNIPLQDLRNKLSAIDRKKPVITCCASGMRSASARLILLDNGFTEVYNGGGWKSLNEKITK